MGVGVGELVKSGDSGGTTGRHYDLLWRLDHLAHAQLIPLFLARPNQFSEWGEEEEKNQPVNQPA